MVPPTPTPSTRLLEAAAAEREALARHRDRLVAARDRLRAELAAAERSLAEVDERSHLLERLIGGHAHDPRDGGEDIVVGGTPQVDARAEGAPEVTTAPEARAASDDDRSSGTTPVPAPPTTSSADARPPGRRRNTPPPANAQAIHAGDRRGGLLRGPAIRRAAVEVLLAQADRPEALHYREWFDLVRNAGFDVAGKDPLAVFLTQLSRSPVIRRGTQAGVYELDLAAPARLGIELDRLHEDLRTLTARPEATADLAAIRARREQLTLEINQTEKALEEAEGTLAAGGALAAFAAAS